MLSLSTSAVGIRKIKTRPISTIFPLQNIEKFLFTKKVPTVSQIRHLLCSHSISFRRLERENRFFTDCGRSSGPCPVELVSLGKDHRRRRRMTPFVTPRARHCNNLKLCNFIRDLLHCQLAYRWIHNDKIVHPRSESSSSGSNNQVLSFAAASRTGTGTETKSHHPPTAVPLPLPQLNCPIRPSLPASSIRSSFRQRRGRAEEFV